MHQAGELPETLRVSKIHYEPPKTVCETPFASIFPPLMENGDGTRCANRFENWTDSSQLCYRNVNTNLASLYESEGEPIRFIAEVQFHFRDFFPLGKLLHKTSRRARALTVTTQVRRCTQHGTFRC